MTNSRWTKPIFYSKLLSSFGSSFSNYAIPLFIYKSTQNVSHVGLQWAIIAIVGLLSGYIGPRLNLFKNDKTGYIGLDILMAIAAIIPLAFIKTHPVLGSYLATFFMAFFGNLQNSYFESLVSKAVEDSKGDNHYRIYLLSHCENGAHIGKLLGYGMAFIVSSSLGFEWAFIIDAATFIASALLVTKLAQTGHHTKEVSKASYSLIFRPKLFNLSIAQLFGAFAVYIFNGIWIVVIKKYFNASDFYIALTFILQYIVSIVASRYNSHLSKRGKSLSDNGLFWVRASYGPLFILLAYTTNIHSFIFIYTVFNFLIPFSLPGIKAMFHRSVAPSEVRGVAASRVGLTHICGALGAVVGSLMNTSYSFKQLCLLSAAAFIAGAAYFYIHLKKTTHLDSRDLKSNKA